jgi:uncharacterized protein (TIGR00156 family)
MKTSKVLAVAVLGVSFALVGNAIAQVAGGFQGPGISDSTVADALKLPDDTPVVLKGKIEKSLGNEKYQFSDGTGVIVVEIDNEEWRGLTVTPENSLGGNIVAIASTEMGCWSDDMSYSLSVLSEGADYEWVSIYEAWGGAQGGVELDCMIFPKVSGTGLTEADVETLSYIFPNPAKDEVMVASSLTMERVEIVNMLGQVVFAADVNANSVKVNTAEMGAGNYLVKMYTEAGMATKKLVVE